MVTFSSRLVWPSAKALLDFETLVLVTIFDDTMNHFSRCPRGLSTLAFEKKAALFYGPQKNLTKTKSFEI